MTTTNQSAIAALVTNMIGATVIAAAKDGKPEVKYTVARLSDKLGTMKNGEKAEYVVLTLADDTAVVMNLHPEHAKRLFKKGEDSGLTVVAKEVAGDEQPTAEEQKDLQAELTGEQASTATVVALETTAPITEEVKQAAVVEAAAAPAADKKLSKKDQFMAIYKAGGTRKEVSVKAAAIGVSGPGFNTYYQNAKSGKWV